VHAIYHKHFPYAETVQIHYEGIVRTKAEVLFTYSVLLEIGGELIVYQTPDDSTLVRRNDRAFLIIRLWSHASVE
jgi:hypothetical protein